MRFATALLATVATSALGCATASQSGFLEDYSRLQDGDHLEKYWADTTIIKTKEYSAIRVGDVDTTRISDQDDVTVEECAGWVGSALWANAGPLATTLKTGSEQADLELHLAITEMTPGSSAGRMFAGELGMGHAVVQVEGRLVDVESGQVVVAFADRRRSSGTIGLEDLGGNAGPGLVRRMLEQIASGLVHELGQSGL